MSKRPTGLVDGQVMYNGRHWMVVQQGKWIRVEPTKQNTHEIEVDFND